MSRTTICLSVLVAAAGLGLGCAPHTAGQRPLASPVSPVTSATPGSYVAASTLPVLMIKNGMVLVDGQSLGGLVPKQVKRTHALFEAMKARQGNANISISSYTLSVSGDLDVGRLKSVIQTAAFAGWPRADLETSAGRVSLQTVVPSPPDSTPKLDWPEEVLVLVVRTETVEVWRMHPEEHGGEKIPPSATQLLNANAALAARLGEECGRAPCSPAVVFAANDASFERLEKALASLSKASETTPLEVELRLAEPGRTGTTPQLRVGSTSMGGRLPPELIQKVVRDAYGRLRRCYESGLAKDAKLEGKVVVRFVITREGKVRDASVAQGTTMPDKTAIECMVKEYESLSFPAPEGGIVTVVYPIMFSPE